MDVTTFFTRFLQPSRVVHQVKSPDDISDFDTAWRSIKATLSQPDERQLARGIKATDVPARLKHIVDALIYESGQTDEDTTGVCLEYLLKNDILSELGRLAQNDRPSGIQGEVLKTINDLIVALPERFLVHNAVHRPIRRFLRSCVGDEVEKRNDGATRTFGAAGMDRKGLMVPEKEEDLLDLMCTIASRLRAYPPLLLIFFHDKGWVTSQPQAPLSHTDPLRAPSPTPSTQTTKSHPSSRNTQSAPRFEFLLFSYLLRYAHREGKTGDLARAGLLFLFDIAFLTPEDEGGENLHMSAGIDGSDPLQDVRDAFAEYILDGDFADVMAAGLGAIYSLLPSKLKVPTLSELAKTSIGDGIKASRSGGMHLGATLDDTENDEQVLRLSTDPDVRDQLDLLTKLLGFLQDIIYRCYSPLYNTECDKGDISNSYVFGAAISDATLDAMNASFIENVIYPSILECSPSDGSSVAVMTYLKVILSQLDDGPLLQKILGVLLNLEEYPSISRPGVRNDVYADEGRFSLNDLILDNIASPYPQAITAALRLLETLLTQHCHGVRSLIHSIRAPGAMSRWVGDHGQTAFLPHSTNSTNVHLKETELYGSLISRIDPSQTNAELAAGYNAYLIDMQMTIQADTCFVDRQIPMEFLDIDANEKDLLRIGSFDIAPLQHCLSPGDPLVTSFLMLLGQFMCSTPDANVALTGVLTSMAACPSRSLAGWMLYETPVEPDPWDKGAILSDNKSDVSLDAGYPARLTSSDNPFSACEEVELPAIYQVLRNLVRQINRFRLDVDDFDRLLAERRQGLLFTDNLDEAMNVMLDVEPSVFASTSVPNKIESPQTQASRPSLVEGLKSFLTPKRKTSPATPSSTTPAKSVSVARRPASLTKTPNSLRSHYEQTAYFSLEAHSSSPIASGPWSPGRTLTSNDDKRPNSTLRHTDLASVFNNEQEGKGVEEMIGPRKVTLSSVLDNCVILEEFLKEIVAIITARRALRVDQVGFISV